MVGKVSHGALFRLRIDTYEQDHGLALEFETQQAKAEAATVGQGTRTDVGGLPYGVRRLSVAGGDGGNSSRYLLRRLARAADGPAKDARNRRIFDMWMACYTQEEIGEAVGMTSQAVGLVLKESADLPEVSKPAASHLTDFEVPIYNVWKQPPRWAAVVY